MIKIKEKDVEELVELLIPFIKKRLSDDSDFKVNVKRKNATVESVSTDGNGSTINQNITVKLPYDTTSFSVSNKTGEELAVGDLICIEYCIDLKNAFAVYKVS